MKTIERLLVTTAATLGAILSVAAAASAQDVTFRGKVEDTNPTGFVVAGSNTVLTSSTVNLNAAVGAHFLVTGTWNGSVSAPSVVVTQLTPVAESFSIGGNGKLGEFIDFNALAAPGDLAVVVASLSATMFVPVDGAGVAFIDVTNMLVIGVGTVGGNGEYKASVLVPNNAALQGLDLFGQGVVFPQSGAPFATNPDFKTLGN
jgi:hypothetical protein